ncbi:MAG: ribosome-associated translation inhibitor RaiA [Anaerolineaceae bacterium]|nr:ribosome-associated translation inhibitor RaiA [Anaerolineaceae bacterium]
MTNRIDVYTKNIEPNDRIDDYVNKKVAKLEKFLNTIDDTRIDLSHSKSARNTVDRYVAQITIRGKGILLRSEERAEDIFAAIDKAVDKMQRQIKRYKGKHHRGRGDGTPASAVMDDFEEPIIDEDVNPMIARRKQFNLVPMDELEAIEQMNLLGHENFFIFYNVDTNGINVLYKRRDDTYGLIEPKVA